MLRRFQFTAAWKSFCIIIFNVFLPASLSLKLWILIVRNKKKQRNELRRWENNIAKHTKFEALFTTFCLWSTKSCKSRKKEIWIFARLKISKGVCAHVMGNYFWIHSISHFPNSKNQSWHLHNSTTLVAPVSIGLSEMWIAKRASTKLVKWFWRSCYPVFLLVSCFIRSFRLIALLLCLLISIVERQLLLLILQSSLVVV